MRRFIQVMGLNLALLLTLSVSGCVTRTVTETGEPVTDEVSVNAANSIYNLETGLTLAGHTLVVARKAGVIEDELWAEIQTRSAQADANLELARTALKEYRASGAAAERSALDNAMAALNIAARYISEQARTIEGGE